MLKWFGYSGITAATTAAAAAHDPFLLLRSVLHLPSVLWFLPSELTECFCCFSVLENHFFPFMLLLLLLTTATCGGCGGLKVEAEAAAATCEKRTLYSCSTLCKWNFCCFVYLITVILLCVITNFDWFKVQVGMLLLLLLNICSK